MGNLNGIGLEVEKSAERILTLAYAPKHKFTDYLKNAMIN